MIADFYNRQTSNLLVQRPIAAVSGFSTIWDNVGAIRNRGVDCSLIEAMARVRTSVRCVLAGYVEGD